LETIRGEDDEPFKDRSVLFLTIEFSTSIMTYAGEVSSQLSSGDWPFLYRKRRDITLHWSIKVKSTFLDQQPDRS